MGLFQKKSKIPDGIKIQYYEGDLQGFICNYPCQLLLEDDKLRITKVNPDVTVYLNINRLMSIDIFPEKEYMAKYKGNDTTTSRAKGISKEYYVFNYIDKNNNNKQLVFWGTSTESLKIMKIRETAIKNQKSNAYEI